MTLCDVSPFYCDRGGGIRTVHRARLEWFAGQRRHRYVLVAPGPKLSVTRLAPHVWVVRAYGLPTSRDRDRYRCLVDFPAVRSLVEEIRPDALESHDPYFSMPFALWLRRQGAHRGLLTSFCHTDPVATHLEPYAPRAVVDYARRGFSILQRQFQATFVASDTLATRLVRAGVHNVVRAGFGVDPELLRMRRFPAPERRTRLLYAGRLDADKEFGLVADALPDILRHRGVRVTIAGVGREARRLRRLRHPRLRSLGFIGDPAALRAVYAAHDVLLAPGRYETFGLAALEAAAAGLVVVGPDEGGTGELLRQMASPLAFRAGSRQMFLNRIEAAIEGDAAALVERGRAVAAAHGTWRDAVARHVAVYESLLGEHVTADALDRSA